MPNNAIKVGKIEIEPGEFKSPYMPQNGGKFIEIGEMLKSLAIGIRDNLAVLVVGESGTGKTSAIRYLANLTGNGLRRVNLNGGTTADELVGRILINEKGTYWVDGVLTEAMRNGDWIVLDEINAALPEVLFVLQSVLDDDGYLVLNEKDNKEIVYKHPNFRLFATCNPPEYAGTKEMNKALLSRFTICINADYPTPSKELEIIESHLGNIVAASDMAVKLVDLANQTRKAKEAGNADYAINTRDILNVLRLVDHLDPFQAFAAAFANKLDLSDNRAVMSLAKMNLPSNRKKATMQRKKINTTNEIMIGQSYVIDADMHNAYFGLTDDKTVIQNRLKNEDIGMIVSNADRENAVKGDEFIVDAIFFDDGPDQASETEIINAGDKVASIITFTAGKSKGKNAVMVHHQDIDDSIKILDNLYEIS